MQITLLISKWCPVCPQAEAVWAEVAKSQAIAYECLDVGASAGKAWVSNLRIKTVPAIIIDGKLQGVGVLSRADALRLIQIAKAPTLI